MARVAFLAIVALAGCCRAAQVEGAPNLDWGSFFADVDFRDFDNAEPRDRATDRYGATSQGCGEEGLNMRKTIGSRIYSNHHQKMDTGYPRRKLSAKPGDITMDFEIKQGTPWISTANFLMRRGGLRYGRVDAEPQYASPYIHAAYEAGNESGRLEIVSKPLRPNQFLDPKFFQAFNQYVYSVGFQPTGIPRFTVGVDPERLAQVLRLGESHGPNSFNSRIVKRTDAICDSRAGGCPLAYQGLVMASAMVLRSLQQCVRHLKGTCWHSNHCQRPWLMRTHLGDLAAYTRSASKREHFSFDAHFAKDVLAVLQAKSSSPVLGQAPQIVDYMHVEELAELAGFVRGRDWDTCDQRANTEALSSLPTTKKEMVSLVENLAEHTEHLGRILRSRDCRVYGEELGEHAQLTLGQWLDGLTDGRDLLSDHDSPISKAAFSRNVWNAMGRWRMQNDHKVYIECRSKQQRDCIKVAPQAKGDGSKTMVSHSIRPIAQALALLEETPLSQPTVSEKKLRSISHDDD